MMNAEVFLLLGSNIGDRLSYLNQAIEFIASKIGDVDRRSSVYETEAWGNTEQQSFYNQVLSISTSLNPFELIESVLAIETEIGRVREEKWGSRIIDIDILYYNNQIIDSKDLIIPHPYIAQRRFTIMPLCEIAPDFKHPKLGSSQKELLLACEDKLEVEAVK